MFSASMIQRIIYAVILSFLGGCSRNDSSTSVQLMIEHLHRLDGEFDYNGIKYFYAYYVFDQAGQEKVSPFICKPYDSEVFLTHDNSNGFYLYNRNIFLSEGSINHIPLSEGALVCVLTNGSWYIVSNDWLDHLKGIKIPEEFLIRLLDRLNDDPAYSISP